MTRKRCFKALQRGMTLLELSVVLLILTALAGLALPYVHGTRDSAACQVTDASLHAIKQAIMGGGANSGYYNDTLGKFSQDLQGLASATDPEYGLYYLFSDKNLQENRMHQRFNAKTGQGWRGPYLTTGIKLGTDALDKLDTRFGAFFDATQPAVDAYVHFDIKLHDGPDNDLIKTNTEAALVSHALDAWGRPIILQIPYDINPANPQPYNYDYARLVSAGPTLSQAAIDTKIQYDSSGANTSLCKYPDACDRNNDRVLYFKMPDPLPGGNQPCGGE